MSVKYSNYVNLTSSSEEQPNEKTPSPPPRKKSLSPPQAPSKSISSKSTNYTSSSLPTPPMDPPKSLDGSRRWGIRRGNDHDHQYHPSTMHAHVQPQVPMQYHPAQSMPPSHGMGRGRGAQPVIASSSCMPTDAMRNISIRTSTPLAYVPVQAVQPQPPMQQTAKTTMTQTEVVSLPLVPSSSKLIKPPARSGFGMVGRKVMITANHFLIQLGDKNPHQYDVTITPEVTSKTKCKHIMQCLIEQYKASYLGNRGLAYDGKKSAFATGPLPFKNKEFVIVVPEKDKRQREFKVAVKFAATKDIDHLRQFLSGRQHDNPQETIQALDIVLREAASLNERIIVGRSIFSTAFEMGPLGNGVEYCRCVSSILVGIIPLSHSSLSYLRTAISIYGVSWVDPSGSDWIIGLNHNLTTL
nr:protein argonaute 1-like [Tanacetum cinerariifolium]